MSRTVSTAETVLTLAEKAEKGDTRAAYDLAVMVNPGSLTELLEIVSPDGPTFRAFDAVADGFALAQHLQRKELP